MNGEYISIDTAKKIEEQRQEIERLKKDLEIEKDMSDGMLETIGKAKEYIETNFFIAGKIAEIHKILRGETND